MSQVPEQGRKHKTAAAAVSRARTLLPAVLNLLLIIGVLSFFIILEPDTVRVSKLCFDNSKHPISYRKALKFTLQQNRPARYPGLKKYISGSPGKKIGSIKINNAIKPLYFKAPRYCYFKDSEDIFTICPWDVWAVNFGGLAKNRKEMFHYLNKFKHRQDNIDIYKFIRLEQRLQQKQCKKNTK